MAIAVNPALHGKGAGKLLMAAAEQVARAQAFPAMDLTVNPDNHQAIRFYETLGWSRLTASDQPWRGTMIKSLV